MKALVVKNPFQGHQRGHTVTDPEQIETILAGEHAQHVSVTEVEAPEPPAAKKPK